MFLGRDDFVWWMGVVEDNYDPFLLGRVQVRIFGYHPPKHTQEIKTEDLPWAVCIHSANVMGAYGRPEIGEWVVGFFLDGRDSQEPIIFGTLPGNTISNLGVPGLEWSAPADVSYPAAYYNKNIASDTNRDAYIHDIKGMTRFVMDPKGGITQQPRIELSIPNKYTRIDMYSDSIYPEVPTEISDYLILENGIKTVFAKSRLNDGSMTMTIPGNGQINFIAEGKVGADNIAAGGHITLASKFGNILATTDKGSIQLINTSGNLALVGGTQKSKITIVNEKGSISISNGEGPIGIKTTDGGNIVLSTEKDGSTLDANAGDYLINTRNFFATITQNINLIANGQGTFTSQGDLSLTGSNTTVVGNSGVSVSSINGDAILSSTGLTSVVGNTASIVSSADILVSGTVSGTPLNYQLLATLESLVSSINNLNTSVANLETRVTEIENALSP